MGADIHVSLEKKVKDKWVMVTRLDHGAYTYATNRNYERFGALAGVRRPGPAPIGLPDDISDSTELFLQDWDGDAHSHSWLSLDEACKVWLETDHRADEFALRWPASHYFGLDEDMIKGEYRVIFFFDN